MSDHPKPNHPLGATHIRTYLGNGKWRDDPIQPKPIICPTCRQDMNEPPRRSKYGDCAQCGQGLPKPTGEWTVEQVQTLLGFDSKIGSQRIADAYNAALAAERHTTEEVRKFWRDTYNVCKATLDAEREDFQRQLAAYKELYEPLAKELAAERSKVQTLVDALKDCASRIEYLELGESKQLGWSPALVEARKLLAKEERNACKAR